MSFSPSSDSSSRAPRVAIIGAGLAGLTLARILVEMGLSVKLFDKGRTPGGRLSTRRDELGSFDHGAQYFTVRDEGFQRQVDSWREQGIVSEWRGRFGTLGGGSFTLKSEGPVRYVGVPGMSALAQNFASRLDVREGVRVEHVRREAEAWALVSEQGEALGSFHVVVAAVPAPQAVALVAGSPELSARVAGVRMEPCWAVMVSFAAPVPLPVDGAFVHDSPLSWAARDNSKLGRAPGERWVLHASPEFSREHLEESPESVAPLLVDAFLRAAGVEARVVKAVAHRWRYATAEPALTEGALFDEKRGLGVCGDWCAGSRVEGAYLSGMALARRVAFWKP